MHDNYDGGDTNDVVTIYEYGEDKVGDNGDDMYLWYHHKLKVSSKIICEMWRLQVYTGGVFSPMSEDGSDYQQMDSFQVLAVIMTL